MALYLVQHGKSLSKENDPEQGLSEEGIAEVQRIANVAKGYGVKAASIKHSVKKRARRTAEIFAPALLAEGDIKEITGLKPMDDIKVIAKGLNSKDNIMLVGHLPFMERLTAYLITGSPDGEVFKFQNGGIVCMDQTAQENWVIKWTLMPNIP